MDKRATDNDFDRLSTQTLCKYHGTTTDLINGQTVERERIEFKRGWNPEEIIHTFCAFANDLNNWGGGYVIVGIEENQGTPVLPPFGINPTQLDAIQGEILSLAY